MIDAELDVVREQLRDAPASSSSSSRRNWNEPTTPSGSFARWRRKRGAPMAGPNLLPLPVPARNWTAERNGLNDPRPDGLTTAEKAVLDAIEVHIGDHDEGWPTQGRIARQTSRCDRQVRRVVERLVAQGFLEMRLVASGGELPRAAGSQASGSSTEGTEAPWPSGPESASTRVHAMSGHDVRTGQEVCRAGAFCGPGVRASADLVSDKGSGAKLGNSPKPPRNATGSTPRARRRCSASVGSWCLRPCCATRLFIHVGLKLLRGRDHFGPASFEIFAQALGDGLALGFLLLHRLLRLGER